MSVQQQNLVAIVECGTQHDGPLSDDGVLQVTAVRELDIGDVDSKPWVLVDGLFAMVDPLHANVLRPSETRALNATQVWPAAH